MRKPASRKITSASVELCANLLVQMLGFRKCTEFHLTLTSSPQGLLQNQSLEIILVCIVVLCSPHNNIACIHMCDEYKISNAPNVCHKLSSISLPHERVCSQTIKYQVHQYVANTDISEQFLSKLWTILQLIQFLLLYIDGHPCMASRLQIIIELFIFPRISLHDFPCHRTMKISFRHQVSPWLLFLVFP